MPDITNHESNNWLDGSGRGREAPKSKGGIAENAGVDIDAPPRAVESEKPAMNQPQPEKIPPGGGTKRGM